MRIQPNAHVTLDYTLSDDEGEVLDASGEGKSEPIQYVHGYGMLVPGLESRLTGLEVGTRKTIAVSADEGYGEYDDELVVELDRSDLPNPDSVAVGDELVAEPDGESGIVVHVVEVHEDSVVVDGNHPLAGVALSYDVTVRAVRAATDEEIADAAAELEVAEADALGDGGDGGGDGRENGEAAKNGANGPDVAAAQLVRRKKPLPPTGNEA